MAKSRLSIAKPDIVRLFSELPQSIFTKSDIDRILAENRAFWRLTTSTTSAEFIRFLLDATALKEERIEFPYRPVHRYPWGDAGTFSIVQSINREGYLTHYTAMHLHALTEQLPKAIYFNQESRH